MAQCALTFHNLALGESNCATARFVNSLFSAGNRTYRCSMYPEYQLDTISFYITFNTPFNWYFAANEFLYSNLLIHSDITPRQFFNVGQGHRTCGLLVAGLVGLAQSPGFGDGTGARRRQRPIQADRGRSWLVCEDQGLVRGCGADPPQNLLPDV